MKARAQIYRILNLFCILAAIATAPKASALFSIGNFISDYAEYQKNRDSELQHFEFAPYLGGHYKWKLSSRWEFIPELDFAFHKRPSPNHSRATILLLYPFALKMWSKHYAHFGIGNMIVRVAGGGGTVLMNNGTSYSTFVKANSATYSQSTTGFLSYEYRMRDYLSFKLSTFIAPVLAKKPSFAFSVSTNLYYF